MQRRIARRYLMLLASATLMMVLAVFLTANVCPAGSPQGSLTCTPRASMTLQNGHAKPLHPEAVRAREPWRVCTCAAPACVRSVHFK